MDDRKREGSSDLFVFQQQEVTKPVDAEKFSGIDGSLVLLLWSPVGIDIDLEVGVTLLHCTFLLGNVCQYQSPITLESETSLDHVAVCSTHFNSSFVNGCFRSDEVEVTNKNSSPSVISREPFLSTFSCQSRR